MVLEQKDKRSISSSLSSLTVKNLPKNVLKKTFLFNSLKKKTFVFPLNVVLVNKGSSNDLKFFEKRNPVLLLYKNFFLSEKKLIKLLFLNIELLNVLRLNSVCLSKNFLFVLKHRE